MKATLEFFTKSILLVGVSLALSACATTQMNEPNMGGMRPADSKTTVTPEVIEEARIRLDRSEANVASDWRGKTFEEFEATVYREPGGGKYIVSGDTAFSDRKHLEEFFKNSVQQPRMRRGLAVMNQGGVDAAWSDSDKHSLSYCVSTGFGTTRYNQVLTAMNNATNAWEHAADIDFIHASAHDGTCTATNSQVVFDVRPTSGAPYLARAFFPDDPRSQRNVLIDDSSFALGSGNLTLEGILRHELGHTLGFRHEHTRPEAGTCFEDDDWRPLTDYDAFSVMHYPQCNGAGDWSLTLTTIDESGAACLYGEAPGFAINPSICDAPIVPVSTGCGPQTVNVSGQLTFHQQDAHGPFAVAPGSPFTVQMGGSGDPDLYVRFRVAPTLNDFDCRPYRTGAIESCDLTVPIGASEAFVMVRGYAPGSYQLTIEHTPSP